MPLRTSPIIHIRTGDLKLVNAFTVKEIRKKHSNQSVICTDDLGIKNFQQVEAIAFENLLKKNNDTSAVFFKPMMSQGEPTATWKNLIEELPVLDESYHLFLTARSTADLSKEFVDTLRKYRTDHIHYFENISDKISRYFTDTNALFDTEKLENNENSLIGYYAYDGLRNTQQIERSATSNSVLNNLKIK